MFLPDRRSVSILSLSVFAFALAGCSAGFNPAAGPVEQAAGAAFGGSLFGGRQPIQGAHIYLYQASNAGYGSASISLFTAYTDTTGAATSSQPDANGNYYLITDSLGNFNVAAGEFTCTVGQQVYLYATGGNPGSGNNTAATLMSVLGTCLSSGGGLSAIKTSQRVQINELSTVAAAYALAGYATDPLHIANAEADAAHTAAGTTALAHAGLVNAFNTAASLYTIQGKLQYANATTVNGNGTVPQAELNTIANALANCINSTGPTSNTCGDPNSNPRTGLFPFALSNGATGTAPTDTATAAINIAHFPGNQAMVAHVYPLGNTRVSPFVPALLSAPNDFSVGITYTGGLNAPYKIAIDAGGNAWVTNNGSGTVTELTNLGVPATGSPFSGGMQSPVGIALDGRATPGWRATATTRW